MATAISRNVDRDVNVIQACAVALRHQLSILTRRFKYGEPVDVAQVRMEAKTCSVYRSR